MYALSIDYFESKEESASVEKIFSEPGSNTLCYKIIKLNSGIDEDIAICLMNQIGLDFNEKKEFDIVIQKIKYNLEENLIISHHLRHLVKLIDNYSEEIIEKVSNEMKGLTFGIKEPITVDELRNFIMSTKNKKKDFILHCLTLCESESKSELGDLKNKVTDWKNMFSKIYEYINNHTFLNCVKGFCIYDSSDICENCDSKEVVFDIVSSDDFDIAGGDDFDFDLIQSIYKNPS